MAATCVAGPAACAYTTPEGGTNGNGDGNCGKEASDGELASGATCVPECDTGYTLVGEFVCADGVMTTNATCVADTPEEAPAAAPCPYTTPEGGTNGNGDGKCGKEASDGSSHRGPLAFLSATRDTR